MFGLSLYLVMFLVVIQTNMSLRPGSQDLKLVARHLVLGEKKDYFFLRTLIRADAANLIAPACLSGRWRQKKCQIDRKSVE